MLEKLKEEVNSIGKKEWRSMLEYVADLHEKSIHTAVGKFPFEWEEIGPGYCYRPAFGHWDIVHAVMDSMETNPEHAMKQIINHLSVQQADGCIPGVMMIRDGELLDREECNHFTHPPVWPVAAQTYYEKTKDVEFIKKCYVSLIKLIDWFEKNRKADGEGFYYTDILSKKWESGVDEGVRFDDVMTGPYACVDATAHVYLLYHYAALWSNLLGENEEKFKIKIIQLAQFMQNQLFDNDTGLFYDIWAINDPALKRVAFEGMWPMVVGAATKEQANRVIDENLLNPKRFFTEHPIASVGINDSSFELRMWRGPTWNSMTYWAARGCVHYDRLDAAEKLLERALDATATQFKETGTIWEFYHPHIGNQMEVARKPHTPYNTPCKDYLGHNPLIAMARMWDIAKVRNRYSGV